MGHKDEYELIKHSHLADCSMFLVELYYRPLHLHKELELILVLEGTGTVMINHECFTIAKGDVLLFDSGDAHELSGGERGILLLAIQITRGFCKRYFPQLRSTRFHATQLNRLYNGYELGNLHRNMLGAFRSYMDRSMCSGFACMGHINFIFESLLSHVPYQVLDQSQIDTLAKYENRTFRMLHYLDEHFREPVRLKDLASSEGISETHMSHFFRDQMNITFQDYLARLRVEAAMYLLKTTDLSVTNISYECGFSDPKYLNQNFKKILGISPQQWRQGTAKLSKEEPLANNSTMQHIFSEEESTEYLSKRIRQELHPQLPAPSFTPGL